MTTPQTAPPAATRGEYIAATVAIVLGLALGIGLLFTPVAEDIASFFAAAFAPIAHAFGWLAEVSLGLAQFAWQAALGLSGLA
jgi:hypothetical protein